jgi:hypothetical protein
MSERKLLPFIDIMEDVMATGREETIGLCENT